MSIMALRRGTIAPHAIIPANTVAPAVTGTATVGQTLTTTNGTWTGTSPSFTYQWQRDSVNIGSATASTYVLVDADYTKAVRCVVTATNGGGAVSANSNATAAVVRTYAQQVLADSPLLYWRLGEPSFAAVADASGNGRTGNYSGGGITYGVTGAVTGNTAITTNSIAGRAQSDATLDLSSFAAITIEIWVSTTYGAGTDKLLMETSANAGSNVGAFYIDALTSLDTATVEILATGAGGACRAKFPKPTNATYHHLVFTFTTGVATASSAWTVRVDKVAQTVTGVANNAVAALGNYTLNLCSRNAASLFLGATVDELAIYGSALSTARTDAHFDASAI